MPIPAEAPVISVTGRKFAMAPSASLAPRAGDPLAQLDPLARGGAEQSGGPPEQVVLEFGDVTVRVGDLPHHFDDPAPSGFVERAVDEAGEMIEIDRLMLGLRGLGHELVGGGLVEP